MRVVGIEEGGTTKKCTFEEDMIENFKTLENCTQLSSQK